MKCLQSFDNMCKKIVSPIKFRLNEREIIQRQLKGKNIKYQNLSIKNQRGLTLSGLFFHNNIESLPTILYLHGNGGSKLQILSLIRVDSKKYNYCSFDFSGCGKSQGQFITYGKNQVKDIDIIIKHLQSNFKITQIHLWGRSMGAVAAIMYAKNAQITIKCMILDSPFTKLQKVLKNVASKQSIPSLFFYIALYFIKNKVEQIASTNIFQQSFSNIIKSYSHIPILFGYSQTDDIVIPQDVIELYQAYQGQKCKFIFQSSHSDQRPPEFIKQSLQFIDQKSTIVKLNMLYRSDRLHNYSHSSIVSRSKENRQ